MPVQTIEAYWMSDQDRENPFIAAMQGQSAPAQPTPQADTAFLQQLTDLQLTDPASFQEMMTQLAASDPASYQETINSLQAYQAQSGVAAAIQQQQQQQYLQQLMVMQQNDPAGFQAHMAQQQAQNPYAYQQTMAQLQIHQQHAGVSQYGSGLPPLPSPQPQAPSASTDYQAGTHQRQTVTASSAENAPIDPNEDFEGDFAANRSKTKMIAAIAIFGVLAALAIAWFVIGDPNVKETVVAENPEEPELSMSDPDFVFLETYGMEVRTDPPNARVVINGARQDGVTPNNYQFISNEPNTVSVFADGYLPSHIFVADGTADPSEGLSLTLQPMPEPPPLPEGKTEHDPMDLPTAQVLFKMQNPEDDPAQVYLDGRLVGETPYTGTVARKALHHVEFIKEGKANAVVLFQPMLPNHQVEVLLNSGVYEDRRTEVAVDPAPNMAELTLDDISRTGGASYTEKKGALVRVSLSFEPDYEPTRYTFHTTKAGTFIYQPVLKRIERGPAQVQWITEEGSYVYACIKPDRGRGFCWDEKKNDAPKEVLPGEYNLIAWEQLEGHSSNQRRAKNKPKIVIESNKSYKFKLAVDDTDTAIFEVLEEVDWSPTPEGETPPTPE